MAYQRLRAALALQQRRPGVLQRHQRFLPMGRMVQYQGDPFLGGLVGKAVAWGAKKIGQAALGIGRASRTPGVVGGAVRGARTVAGGAILGGIGAKIGGRLMGGRGDSAGHRRMNAANVKALRRAIRRVESFHKLATSAVHVRSCIAPKRRAKKSCR